MHGLARDMAIWISIETRFFCQAGTSVSVIPQKLQKSLTRTSFMNCNITRIPSQLFRCSSMTVLLLQGNPLEKIPDNLFREVRALRVLNLSGTLIKSLPSTLLHLVQLRAFLVRDCCYLEKLPLFGDLCELQMLDLSGTRLRELPWKRGEPRAAIDELLSLQKLSVLHLRLDSANCLTLESDWLKRLRKFNIRISPRNCHSNFLPTQHEEKRVILRGVDLMTGGLEGLFCNASALDLVNCGGMDNLSEVVVRHKLHGLSGLKSLTISSCDWITTILEGIVPKRGCLGMLKTLEVVDCRRLENQLISFSFLRQLKNLEEIKVGECRRIKRLIAGSASNSELPKLKTIEMWDMVNLKGVCTRTVHLPVLERIGVSNCSLLVKLPITAYNAAAIKEIRGELEWWNNIAWQDYEIKSLVQRRFQACAVSTSLGKEERAEEPETPERSCCKLKKVGSLLLGNPEEKLMLFQSNVNTFEKEMDNLPDQRKRLKHELELADRNDKIATKQYKLGRKVGEILKEVERLQKAGSFHASMVISNHQASTTRHIPGP
ncbi:hypothetical protein POTOM_006727 [Populus tomentosa]|uniref:Disease resistance protein At4g27190-like leucine-rich repeats domain-containing protein n=1 Tax=Populus tomentosa TaxID=118781 RepID=A0A8X8AYA1_POPTO|nr:hypothetical protein POTOM_006727 [Populus tomentosa]